MGLLDDAIREHLELKRRSGVPEEEVTSLEHEAFGSTTLPGATAGTAAPEADDAGVGDDAAAAEPAAARAGDAAPEAAAASAGSESAASAAPASEYWLDEPDEVPSQEALDHRRQPTHEFTPPGVEAAGAEPEWVAPDEEPGAEDVLEETPEFLQETPEHDRLWFEQKPPKDFDFGG